MERPRSFRSLVIRTTGSGQPPTPTTATTSTAPTAVLASAEPTTAPASAMLTTASASAKPTTVPASARPTTVPPSEPRDTSSAKKTTTTAKGSRLPFVTRTEVVAALPASLPSDYDAKRAAKGKGHEGDDRKRSSDRDDVIDVDRVSKKARARSASPPRRVSRSVFQDRASASSLFSTLFFAFVNKVGHELEAKVEVLKEKLEDEMRRTENARTAAEGLRVERNAAWASIDKKNKELTDQAKAIVFLKAEARKYAEALLTEAERSAIALAAGEEREQCSAAIVMKHDGELATVVEKLRKADGHIQSLERNFARAKGKFDEHQGDPRSNMVYQVQRVANLDFVRLLLGLLDDQEPPKLEDELAFLTADVAEHIGDEERFEQLMTSLHGLLHVFDPEVSGALSL
ncbi:hypothetical protein AALP_AA3G228900 [Arabis alpina]|uniref:Uncharacterized protein n=1 Tax=Arabis alpina TaxID=50452 RepID=A0A087HB14_ARAAL|nr:hypothetical protein AALP_AA3G228900 [Arabis alpina]